MGNTKPPVDKNLTFIVSTSSPLHTNADRQRIRNHARRNRRPRRLAAEPSWTSSEQCVSSSPRQSPASPGWIPHKVGSELSLLDFPGVAGLEPELVVNATKCIHLIQATIYPSELCQVGQPLSGGLFDAFWSDRVYFHSLLFSAAVLADAPARRRSMSVSSMKYLSQTMQLLQDRLGQPDPIVVASDGTIMTVVGLAATAGIYGDMEAARSHASGLFRLVALRGGFGALAKSEPGLKAKVCKIDVEVALCTGQRPLLPVDSVCWEPFIARQGLIRRLPDRERHNHSQDLLLGMDLDPKLLTMWADLQEMARLLNLAHQTTRKIPAVAFNEIEVSILYRLIFLNESYRHASQGALFTRSLLAFAFTIFLQHQHGVMQRFDRLLGDLRNTIRELISTDMIRLPHLKLWMLMTLRVAMPTNGVDGLERKILNEAMPGVCIDSWPQVQTVLKEISWIECLQGQKGKTYFMSVLGSNSQVPL